MEKISGIYCITNLVNNKKYIGKSINIESRCKSHLNEKYKKVNRHLQNAFDKYGGKNFTYSILENIPIEKGDNYFKNRELYWIDYYRTTEREYGYNLRRDSSTNMIVHEETRQIFKNIFKGNSNPNYNNYWSDEQKKRMSEIKKQQYSLGIVKITEERKKLISERSKQVWQDEQKRKDMAIAVSKARRKANKFLQYTKENILIKEWDNVEEIIKSNPDYKWQNIYAACNGNKKSYKGYIWKMINKI